MNFKTGDIVEVGLDKIKFRVGQTWNYQDRYVSADFIDTRDESKHFYLFSDGGILFPELVKNPEFEGKQEWSNSKLGIKQVFEFMDFSDDEDEEEYCEFCGECHDDEEDEQEEVDDEKLKEIFRKLDEAVDKYNKDKEWSDYSSGKSFEQDEDEEVKYEEEDDAEEIIEAMETWRNKYDGTFKDGATFWKKYNETLKDILTR